MKHTPLITVAVAMLLASALVAQQRRQQEVDLQRAIRTETVDRDCNMAIKQYAAIVSKYKDDRATVATALMHQADCYRQLGDSQARAIYERIVRDFPDRQEEAALARERLGAAGHDTARVDRAVWMGSDVDYFGQVSADGRYLTYTNWNDNGALMLRDLATGTARQLTASLPDDRNNYLRWSERSAISRDGKQVAYVWRDSGQPNHSFFVADLTGTGFIKPRLLNHDCYVSLSWAPDGNSIGGLRFSGTLAELGVISVADGSFRILKSAPASVFAGSGALNGCRATVTSLRFSPDAKYLAYDRTAEEGSPQHDIFVIDVASGREIPALVQAADERVVGWAEKNSTLLFTTDRTGSVGLWGMPVQNGRPIGSPHLLKGDTGSIYSMGLTERGTLYVYKRTNARDVLIAPVDLALGKLLASPAPLPRGFSEEFGNVAWSPDGQSLAAHVPCPGGFGYCVAIRSVRTGETRRVGTSFPELRGPTWASDGRSVIARGTDANGHQGIFRIDADTGAATPLLIDERLTTTLATLSPDGQKLYFNRRLELVERDLNTGSERVIFREADPNADVRNGALSPDGRLFVVPRELWRKTASILIVPVDGGPQRELLRLAPPESAFLPRQWTPDSRGLLVEKNTGTRSELWMYPVDGNQPRKLDIDPLLWRKGGNTEGALILRGDSGFALSPDARQIAMTSGETTAEVWALENILPR